MRRSIDCIIVHDSSLAFAIIEALEKDGEYAVDFYDHDRNGNALRKDNGPPEIELHIYYNEKVMPAPTTGFVDGECKE